VVAGAAMSQSDARSDCVSPVFVTVDWSSSAAVDQQQQQTENGPQLIIKLKKCKITTSTTK
jgi:hypothetical protein